MFPLGTYQTETVPDAGTQAGQEHNALYYADVPAFFGMPVGPPPALQSSAFTEDLRF
jgi:hypothetical protein